MKKILMIINDTDLPGQVLDAAVYIAKKAKGSLFALFLESSYPHDMAITPLQSNTEIADSALFGEKKEQASSRFGDTRIKLIEEACAAEQLPFHICRIQENYLDSLIDQSVFADLIICDARKEPTQFSLKSLLADALCPVMLIPENYRNFDKVIFTYDGNTSSMYAIRMFTYLFSFARDLPVYLVSVLPTNIRGIEYEELIKEWLPLYYSNAAIKIIKGEAKEELPVFISQCSNALVVIGAYGRSALSRLFKESLAHVILEKTDAPVFITHD